MAQENSVFEQSFINKIMSTRDLTRAKTLAFERVNSFDAPPHVKNQANSAIARSSSLSKLVIALSRFFVKS